MTSDQKQAVAKPRLSWFRFGIKAVLLMTVFASVAFTLIALVRHRDLRFEKARQHIAEKQGAIIVEWERVNQAGGAVASEDSYGERPVFVLSFAHKPVTDDDLEAILPALENPETRIAHLIDLSGTAVTDDGVRRLQAAAPDCRIRR